MDQEVISRSAADTLMIASEFAKEQLSPGSLVILRGPLGAGKTQFAKGIAKAFGLEEDEISSPTYALVNEYEISFHGAERFYHLDCYRFDKPEELIELGIEEYLYPKHAITVIEWPERIEVYLPENRIEVTFFVTGPSERRITIQK